MEKQNTKSRKEEDITCEIEIQKIQTQQCRRRQLNKDMINTKKQISA